MRPVAVLQWWTEGRRRSKGWDRRQWWYRQRPSPTDWRGRSVSDRSNRTGRWNPSPPPSRPLPRSSVTSPSCNLCYTRDPTEMRNIRRGVTKWNEKYTGVCHEIKWEIYGGGVTQWNEKYTGVCHAIKWEIYGGVVHAIKMRKYTEEVSLNEIINIRVSRNEKYTAVCHAIKW